MIIRGTVALTDATGKAQTVQAEGYAGDVRDDLEVMEQYGLTSRPRDAASGAGPECLILDLGDTSDLSVVLAVGDRRYRIKGLAKGEACLYDDQGQKVYLTRNGIRVQPKAGGFVEVLGSDVRLGDNADAALVRWPELQAYLTVLTLPVSGSCDPILKTITGVAGPPVDPVPEMGTSTVTAK